MLRQQDERSWKVNHQVAGTKTTQAKCRAGKALLQFSVGGFCEKFKTHYRALNLCWIPPKLDLERTLVTAEYNAVRLPND